MEKRQKRQAHSPSFAIFEACADLAPASWSAAVRSAALDFSPLHRRQQRKRSGERGNRIFTGGSRGNRLRQEKTPFVCFVSFVCFCAGLLIVEAKAPEKTG